MHFYSVKFQRIIHSTKRKKIRSNKSVIVNLNLQKKIPKKTYMTSQFSSLPYLYWINHGKFIIQVKLINNFSETKICVEFKVFLYLTSNFNYKTCFEYFK